MVTATHRSAKNDRMRVWLGLAACLLAAGACSSGSASSAAVPDAAAGGSGGTGATGGGSAAIGGTAAAAGSAPGGAGSGGIAATEGGGTGGAGGAECPTELGFPGACDSTAPTTCCAATLPVMTRAGSMPPDWSCIGIGSGGSGGSSGVGENVFRLVDFVSEQPAGDVEVELYAGDAIIGKTPFYTGFTKGPAHPGPLELAIGELYFANPGSGTLSYRAKATGAAKETFGFGHVIPAPPGAVMGVAISSSGYVQLAMFAVPLPGWTPPADLGIVIAPIVDCSGNDVGGALAKLVDVATGQEVRPGSCERDVRYLYFDPTYPNPKCAFTAPENALFLVANAPSSASGVALRLELWGRLQAADTAPKKFAERAIDVFPDTINVHLLRPNVPQ